MMEWFTKKQTGAISIFLAIILLPMMAVASIYIDASRVKLASSMISSAGDLTLNTALTNYDNVLKEMYGLFAMSQSEEELYENLEDYYMKSLTSAGLSAEDATTYVGKIMAQLGMVGETGDVGDLLRIELQDEEQDESILKTDETKSLANPYMLKKQVVEFMKYRFGLGVGLSFLSSLQSFKGLDKQKEVVDRRTEYYEEQRNVVEACEAAWKAISQYNELKTNVEFFDTLKTDLETAVDNYKYINKNFIMDFYNSKERPGNGTNYFSMDTMIVLREPSDKVFDLYLNGSKYTNYGSYTDEKPATESQLNSFLQDMIAASDKYNQLKSSSEYDEVFNTGSGAGIYEVQRVIQFNRLNTKSDSLGQQMKKYHIAFQSLKKAVDSVEKSKTYYEDKSEQAQEELDALRQRVSNIGIEIRINDGLISGIETEIDSLRDDLDSAETSEERESIRESIESKRERISDLQDDTSELEEERDTINNTKIPEKVEEKKKYDDKVLELKTLLEKTVSYHGTSLTYKNAWTEQKKNYDKVANVYAEVVKRMEQTVNASAVSKSFINKQNASDSNKNWVAGTKSSAELQRISTTLTTAYDTLKKASEYLGAANKQLDTVISKLSPGGDLTNKQEAWDKTATNSEIEGTAISTQNKQEIEAVKEFMDIDEVKILKTRIDNTKKTIDDAIADIEACTYADGMIKDINSMDALMKKIEACSSNSFDLIHVALNKTKLETFCNQVYTAFMKHNDEIFAEPWKTESGEWKDQTHPVLDDGETCNFYKYLKKNFPKVLEENSPSVKDTDVKDGAAGDAEKTFEETKKQMDAKGDEVAKSDSSVSKPVNMDGDMPSKGWGSMKANVTNTSGGSSVDFSNLGTLCSSITNLVGNFTTDLRDSIYVSDYILNMFSYDTYEKEIIYDLNNVDNGNTVSNLNYVMKNTFSGSVYSKNEGEASDLTGDLKGITKEQFLKEAQTLTNVAISPDNNAAYLKEVEYILYGKSDSAGSAYGTIYMIRSAFNTVYAFTDSEIREGAYSVALAVFGCPPLTFLVPIAQAAIIIAVALAESAIDLAMLKAGMAVPLFKTKDSWVLKFSSLMSNLTGAAIDFAADAAVGLAVRGVDTATSKLNEWLDKTDEEINELIENSANSVIDLNDNIEGTINENIQRYTDTVINQVINICQIATNLADESGKIISKEYPDGIDIKKYVADKLKKWLDEDQATYSGKDIANDIGYIAKQAAVEYVLSTLTVSGAGNIIQTIIETITSAESIAKEQIESFSSQLNDKFQNISKKVSQTVQETCDKVIAYKDAARTKVDEAIASGGEKVKENISEIINGTAENLKDSLGNTSTGTTFDKDSNSTAACFSFHYSDYLRLFLVLNLLFNEENTLVRTSDVIQNNMQLKSEGSTYLMKHAYTYAEIAATFKVKPLMIALPFMDAFSEGKLTGDGWYTIEYRDLMGY